MALIFRFPPPQDPLPAVSVNYWYDRSLRSWTIYPVDADNNQIGCAQYTSTKREAAAVAGQIARDLGLPVSTIRLLRSGE